MSLNVLIVAEDYRQDQYILKPIIQSMLVEVGKPNANVRVCRDPMISGVDQALDVKTIEDVILTNPQVDLYLLVVDRDGDQKEKSGRLQDREDDSDTFLRDGQALFGGQAHQEVEVWLLAGQDDLPADWNWDDVRAEPHPKEQYYQPFAEAKDLANSPGAGRKPLGEIAGTNYRTRVRAKCDEVQNLQDRIAGFV